MTQRDPSAHVEAITRRLQGIGLNTEAARSLALLMLKDLAQLGRLPSLTSIWILERDAMAYALRAGEEPLPVEVISARLGMDRATVYRAVRREMSRRRMKKVA